MELSELERLVELVQNANIAELTLKQGAARVTIRKAARGSGVMSTALVPLSNAYVEETEFLVTEDEDDPDPEEEPPEQAKDTMLITSPLVGVFGHVKPLIGLGAKVKEGQVVGIIEAMKLVSEVKSAANGVVINVLVEDGLPVEYGQGLFEIYLEG
jgi:acetyl-CoA carboxylase biotin carboxyl carrier protein